jgi:predicted amidohydrolase
MSENFCMRLLFVFALACGFAQAADLRNLIVPPAPPASAGGEPQGWSYWAPRAELTQEHGVVAREDASTLMLRSRDFTAYGYWLARVTGVKAGGYYRLEALYQTEGIREDTGGVFAVISWYGEGANGRELQRDYVDEEQSAGAWVRTARTVQAPPGAATARVELGLRRTPSGTVYWRDPVFAEVPAPAPRIVRVATTRVIAANPASIAANEQRMAEILEKVGPEKPDVVLLSENLNTRGVRLPLEQKAETIPGPLTDMLAAKAKKFSCNVITTLPERDGKLFHNTAVWIDRTGRIAGKYRKVHLTIGEMEAGLTPGSEFPVFETDFGRIGIVTCWDNWFPEPMRILRLRGAEMVFMPLAGDGDPAHWNAVWPARAIDNGVYLVTSSTVGDTESRIINPKGEIIAETKDKFAYAIAEVDLNKEWRLRYLSVGNGTGEARSLYMRERRPETYGPLMKDSEALPGKPGT